MSNDKNGKGQIVRNICMKCGQLHHVSISLLNLYFVKLCTQGAKQLSYKYVSIHIILVIFRNV